MIINHNMSSIDTNRVLGVNTQNLAENMAKLSSGERINKAGDDASGLAVSEKMRSQIRGLNMASRDMADGVSFIQTAEGHLQGTTNALQRVRELAVQAANGTYTDEDRLQIQVEVSQMVAEVNRVASQAQFNGMTIFTGRFANSIGMQIQMGANMDQHTNFSVGDMGAAALGLTAAGGEQGEGGATLSLSTVDSANQAIGVLDNALKIVNKQRSDLGALQNRMSMAIKGTDIASENLQASESQIRDLNMAKGAAEMSKNSILQSAGVAMLAQANQANQGVLQLLR